MDLSLNEEQSMIQEMARKFAITELMPAAEQLINKMIVKLCWRT